MKMSDAPPLTPALKEKVSRKIFQLQLVELKQLFEHQQSCDAEERPKIWNKLGAISGVHYVTI